MRPPLLPCPHCGGEARLRTDNMMIRHNSEKCAWVYCTVCNARTGYFRRVIFRERYAVLAVEAWNMRTGESNEG